MNRRILHCIATLEGGGAERQLCYLAKSLVSAGWDVHVAVLKRGINYTRLLESGAIIHEIKSNSNYDLTIIIKIYKLVRANKISIVQCWQRPMDLLAALGAFLAGIPFITTERTSPSRYSKSLKGLLKFAIAQFAFANISNSKVGKEYWDQKLLRSIPNVMIPNIIPLEELDKVVANRENGKYIVVVGRLAAEKNHVLIIESLVDILNADPLLKLLLVGEGESRDLIVRSIQEHKLENQIVLTGYRTDVWSLIKGACLFISMSHFEGMPNVVFEAAALKCPLILSDIPAHRSYFDENSAILVDPISSNDLKKSVDQALRHRGATLARANAAYTEIQKFSAEKVSHQYSEFYCELL